MIIKIASLRLVTENPKKLIKDLFNKIDNYEIRTWIYDEDENLWHT